MNDSEVEAGLAETPSYRYADVVGSQLFVAGQVPLDGDGNLLANGDPAGQAVACLDNLRVLVEVNGFAVEDVHQLVVYVVGEHQNLLDAWSAVAGWFDNNVPPATLLGVNLLGYSEQLVEIDATVIRSVA
jgi:enamine deaminase RidA (YjgF/YER057c/UK114 family)